MSVLRTISAKLAHDSAQIGAKLNDQPSKDGGIRRAGQRTESPTKNALPC